MSKTHSYFGSVCVLVAACSAAWPRAASPAERDGGAGAIDVETSFRAPPDAAKPWAYWWWLNANVTRESITRDLEEMKKKGIGGFLLFDVTAYGQQHVAFAAAAHRVPESASGGNW